MAQFTLTETEKACADGYGIWHCKAATAMDARGAILDELEERGDATPGEYDVEIAPCPVDLGCWVEVTG